MIFWEAINGFNPQEVNIVVIVVAFIGVIINGLTTILQGKKHDLNIRGAYLHMLADTLVSVGVVVFWHCDSLHGIALDRPFDEYYCCFDYFSGNMGIV